MAKIPLTFPPVPPPHPDSAQLERAIGRCLPLASSWDGIAYRAASPGRANVDDLLTGIGSRITGGRWSPLGAFAAVYLSCEHQTSTEEFLAGNRRRGLPDSMAMPYVMTAVAVRLTHILDISDGQVRRTLRVSEERLLREPWWGIQDRGEEALTQAIGRLARAAGIKGLVVPSSARPDGSNLVIFPDNVTSGVDRLDIVNPSRLPSPPAAP